MHGASFLNRARNSRCTVITDLNTSKRSTEKAFSYCDAILETSPAAPLPRSKHEKRTVGSARDTCTVAAADGVRCARVRWEINFLLTFETAPFFCVYPIQQKQYWRCCLCRKSRCQTPAEASSQAGRSTCLKYVYGLLQLSSMKVLKNVTVLKNCKS